jgi:hypothetical protein
METAMPSLPVEARPLVRRIDSIGETCCEIHQLILDIRSLVYSFYGAED